MQLMGDAHYLPQPPLPEVPGNCRHGLAGRTPSRVATGFLLPRRLQPPRANRCDRLAQQVRRLRRAVQGGGRDAHHHRCRPQAPWRAHRSDRRAAHLGISDDTEPSLMIPGIIFSCIFGEQGKLVFRATPWQNQFAGAVEVINDPADGCGVQITAVNFPRCPRSYLFAP